MILFLFDKNIEIINIVFTISFDISRGRAAW